MIHAPWKIDREYPKQLPPLIIAPSIVAKPSLLPDVDATFATDDSVGEGAPLESFILWG
jgi:hypothetical protein